MISPGIRSCTLFLLLSAFSSSGKAECWKPELVGNVVLTDEASLMNDFPDGTEISLECTNGHVVHQGSDVIICKGGTWSTQELICTKKDCGIPVPLPNMKYDIPNGTLFAASIRPFCDRGYYLQGSSYRHCLMSGWSGRSSCFLKKCKKPLEIDNGMIINGTSKKFPEFQDVIQYSCYPNYILEGNSTIVCQDNGEYSSSPPHCKGKRETASNPTESTPGNLHVISTLTVLEHESGVSKAETTKSTPSNLSVVSTISTKPKSRGMVDETSFGRFLSKTEVIGIVLGIVILVPVILFAFYRRLKQKGARNRIAPAFSSAWASLRRRRVSGNADV